MCYTSIEQSKILLKLGLNLESADMFYDGVQDFYKEKVYSIPENGSSITVRTGYTITKRGIKNNLLLPCWSLDALLEMMPSIIRLHGDGFVINVGKLADEVNWYISYEWEHHKLQIFKGSLIEAAYNMVVWLLENNYINKINNGKD